MSMTRTLLFLVLHVSVFLELVEVASAQDYDWFEDFVEETYMSVEPCPCLATCDHSSLSDLLLSLGQSNGSNLTLQLQSGEHCIENFIIVHDIEYLTIIGNDSATIITCSSNVGLAFYNTTGLILSNLMINRCGMNWEYIDEFTNVVLEDIDFFLKFHNASDHIALAVGNSKDFCMENCRVVNTLGLGFIGINLMGASSLTGVAFEGNGFQTCLEVDDETAEQVGGGAIFVFHDYINDSWYGGNILKLTSCTFVNNINCGYRSTLSRHDAYFNLSQNSPQLFIGGGGGGLSVHLTQLQYEVALTISNSSFRNNTGTLGSGALVAVYTGVVESVVNFVHCNFTSGGYPFSSYKEAINGPVFGSALAVVFDYVQPNFTIEMVISSSLATKVIAEDCVFSDNSAYSGTVMVFSLLNLVIPELTGNSVEMRRCTFERNQAVIGSAIAVIEQKFNPYKPGAKLSIENVTISQNTLVKKQRIESPSDASGIIHLLNFNASFIGNNTLKNNQGSALKVDSSLVSFYGNITFLNNSATYGGGILIYNTAYVILMKDSIVHFVSNAAGVSGGAIYVHFNSIYPDPFGSCFLILEGDSECSLSGGTNCIDVSTPEIRVMFERNEASLGGAVYGSTLDECLWVADFRNACRQGYDKSTNIYQLFYEVDQGISKDCNFTAPFTFDQPPDSLTEVATPVLQLNVTDPKSKNLKTEMRLAPGIKKKVNLATYDGFNWRVPTAVTSKAYNKPGTMSVLGNHFAFVDYNSTLNSTLSLLTSANETEGTVTVNLFSAEPYSADWTISIILEDCPDGFYFNESYRNCTCYEELEFYNVYCTEEGNILGPVNTWVGVDDRGYLNLVSCPFDFCQQSVSILEGIYDDYDSQCNSRYNRSGIGCGRCLQNLSLTLGSSDCSECSNGYLFLIPFFAFYGIFLIWFMMQTKFTISGGFLNGLLFFSNILSLYIPVHASTPVFAMFYWLSFRVGFRTCFYDGMKPLELAALNFIFPVYLFLLLSLIYVAADRSSRFSAWLSKRSCTPTQLFVTIIVMTYSSLLESCLEVLSATPVTVFINENETEDHVRWRFDPSQGYFSGFHGALASFCLIILVFFLIPVPVICLLNAFGYQFRCLSRLTPFYDAIWAPFKPQYKYWVSLRMLFRIFPLVFVNLIPSPYHWFLLEIFLLLISFLHGMVQPYVGTAQNVFDGFLQLVLAIITLISFFYSLFINQLGETNSLDCIEKINAKLTTFSYHQYVAVNVTISFAYVACLLMFIWHLWKAFPKTSMKIKAFFMDIYEKMLVASKRKLPKQRVQPTHTVFSLNEESTRCNSPGPYGATLIMKEPATFSELRESLLEDSISAADIVSAK